MNRQTRIAAGKRLVTSKSLFIVTIVVVMVTILGIWLLGLGQHRTLFENSLLSTSILSGVFFLFLFIGLYKGVKLKDDVGKISDKIKLDKMPDLSTSLDVPSELGDFDEGIGGIILAIIAWILFSILLLLFIWIFGAILWTMILIFAAMLYWIFFRAIRLVFKNSNKCKGSMYKSCYVALGYTVLYNFWIYAIILASHYLIK